MFINANPRVVSNGFGTFVPVQVAEPFHQRLVEMTNNDVNAWGVFRPVGSTSDNWDQHIDEFNSSENLPVSRDARKRSSRKTDSIRNTLHTVDTSKRLLLWLVPNPPTYQRLPHAAIRGKVIANLERPQHHVSYTTSQC